MPERLVEAGLTLTAKKSSRHPYFTQVFDMTLKGLLAQLREIHEAYLSPKVTETQVIRYNIE